MSLGESALARLVWIPRAFKRLAQGDIEVGQKKSLLWSVLPVRYVEHSVWGCQTKSPIILMVPPLV